MRNLMFTMIVVLAYAPGVYANVQIQTVPVGNPGNIPIFAGITQYGGVDYEYRMGKYEITAGQYCEFLNAVAATDTYRLYNYRMSTDDYGCKIARTGSSGNYAYSVATDWANRPVNLVSWGAAARFANWMHNGQGSGDTETGAYALNGAMTNEELMAVNREPDATWVIPSEDEWCKAAYHKNDGPSGHYFEYPTSSDTPPNYVDDNGNLSGTGQPFAEGGTDPGTYATYDGDAGVNGIGAPYYRTVVGEWENSPSPYGTFDQGGNVLEWTERKKQDLTGNPLRVGLGGNFVVNANPLEAGNRWLASPISSNVTAGFRLAYVPEPTTFALLALGGLTIMRRR